MEVISILMEAIHFQTLNFLIKQIKILESSKVLKRQRAATAVVVAGESSVQW